MTWPVDPARYVAFLAAMAILAATPGPSNLFAIANGMSRAGARCWWAWPA